MNHTLGVNTGAYGGTFSQDVFLSIMNSFCQHYQLANHVGGSWSRENMNVEMVVWTFVVIDAFSYALGDRSFVTFSVIYVEFHT